MASKKSKPSKHRSGPAKPAFAAMPGAVLAAASAPLEKVPPRWLAPGEAVTVQDILISDGMIYLGSSLEALDGSDVEPSLVNPNLRIASADVKSVNREMHFFPEYRSFSFAERRDYLKWLAAGRKAPNVGSKFPSLFFSGLERRLVTPYVGGNHAARSGEAPIGARERNALRQEVLRLGNCYSDLFGGRTNELLAFIDFTGILMDPDSIYQRNGFSYAVWPRSGDAILPLLAVRLARFAMDKEPLTAGWAWAWFHQTSDSGTGLFNSAEDEEVYYRFTQRFAGAPSSGPLLLETTSAPILARYRPSSPFVRGPVTPITSADARQHEWLRQVKTEPLQLIRRAAYAAIEEVAAEGRRTARYRSPRERLVNAARLGDAYFSKNRLLVEFRQWLDARIPSATNTPAALPVSDLLARWLETDEPAPLTRGGAIALLDTINRLGFATEPDLRIGGAAPAAGKDGGGTIYLARYGREVTKISAPNLVFHNVGLPLLVRAARAAGITEPGAIRRASQGLPYAADAEPAKRNARIAYLLAHPKEGARLPKPKDTTLTELDDADRSAIADCLVAAVSGAAIPAAVAELIRLFALLGLPDTDVYTRLHNAPPVLAARPTPTRSAPAAKPRKSEGVSIDLALVQQKEAESLHVSSLLADIFSEDEPAAAFQPAAEPAGAEEAPFAMRAASPALDHRHAALLQALLEKETWSGAEIAALAKAENLLANAAIEAINEAAYEQVGEPILEGDDTIYVQADVARELLARGGE